MKEKIQDCGYNSTLLVWALLIFHMVSPGSRSWQSGRFPLQNYSARLALWTVLVNVSPIIELLLST